jgi:nitroreductase
MFEKLRHAIGKRYNTISWLFFEYRLLVKHLGSADREKNPQKIKANLIIENHIIEKGLSFGDVKVGFGEEKIARLLDDLYNYHIRYGDINFVTQILSTVYTYIDFNKKNNHKSEKIIIKFDRIKNLINTDLPESKGAIIRLTKEKILGKSLIDFEGFVNSRYSIRNFTGEPIDIDKIKNAIRIAGKTPSACNRQPWKTHLFLNNEKLSAILDFQTGARQFKTQITCAILVTSSYNSFFGGEYHQPYVNGGLYAMTLIFALHSFGLGTIPLNMGFTYKKLKDLKNIVDLSEDEVPIILIGIGNLPESLNVAASERFDYQDILKIY